MESNKVKVTITLDKSVLKKSKEKCDKQLVKLSTMINHLLKNWIKES